MSIEIVIIYFRAKKTLQKMHITYQTKHSFMIQSSLSRRHSSCHTIFHFQYLIKWLCQLWCGIFCKGVRESQFIHVWTKPIVNDFLSPSDAKLDQAERLGHPLQPLIEFIIAKPVSLSDHWFHMIKNQYRIQEYIFTCLLILLLIGRERALNWFLKWQKCHQIFKFII